MNIISCDVGWKKGTTRNAVAVVRDSGEVNFLKSGLDDPELIDLVIKWAEPQALVLLDIPIEGCENLKGPRRDIEDGLQPYISLFPASKARESWVRSGKKLKDKLLQAMPVELQGSIVIKEIYPYAVYKFLWFAMKEGKLEEVLFGKWQEILNDKFTPSKSPRRYKGKKKKFNKKERLDGIQDLYTILTQCLNLGLSQSDKSPDDSDTISKLELRADEYDACLGAVVGIYAINKNPYAWLAGDEQKGEMIILADRWLKKKLEDKVSMKHLY